MILLRIKRPLLQKGNSGSSISTVEVGDNNTVPQVCPVCGLKTGTEATSEHLATDDEGEGCFIFKLRGYRSAPTDSTCDGYVRESV